MPAPAATRHELAAAGAVALVFAVAYSAYGLVRHRHFGSSAFDMGIFDQVVWHLSRFEAPASSVGGYPNIFGDHFHPVIALWAPLYWVLPSPSTLIVAQAVLFAAACVPVFLYARHRLTAGPALALTGAYGLFWGIQRAMAFDVHEYAFAPLAVATAVLAVDRQRWTLFWVAAVAVMLTKEDLIPLVGGFGLYLWAHGDRRRGALAITASVAAFALVIGVLIPSLSSTGSYVYTSAFGGVMRQPWMLPITMVTPLVKVRTMALWLAPFLFLPLASPLVILVPVIAVERFLSSSPNHWSALFHYSAPLAPILAMAAADGLARIGRVAAARKGAPWSRVLVSSVATVIVLACAFLPGRQPLWRVFDPSHYSAPAWLADASAALALIPSDASVVAQSPVVAHLTHRRRIYMLSTMPVDGDYVITSRNLNVWPLDDIGQLDAIVAARFGATHMKVFDRNGWTVWRRMSPDPLTVS